MIGVVWGLCGRVLDFQSRELVFKCTGNFFCPTLPVSVGRDTKSHWSLLTGVRARGSKRSHTGKWKKLSAPHRAGDLDL